MGLNLVVPILLGLQSWDFEHITSSPHFAQSNSKAENAAKTIKHLFQKCKIDMSEFVALLNWRNTPSKGLKVSPAQHLFGRHCKTLLPITESLLKPRYAQAGEIVSMRASKAKQVYYYNRHIKPLKPLNHGNIIHMHLPPCLNNNSGWDLAQFWVKWHQDHEVEINGNVYHRNRCQLVLYSCNTSLGLISRCLVLCLFHIFFTFFSFLPFLQLLLFGFYCFLYLITPPPGLPLSTFAFCCYTTD